MLVWTARVKFNRKKYFFLSNCPSNICLCQIYLAAGNPSFSSRLRTGKLIKNCVEEKLKSSFLKKKTINFSTIHRSAAAARTAPTTTWWCANPFPPSAVTPWPETRSSTGASTSWPGSWRTSPCGPPWWPWFWLRFMWVIPKQLKLLIWLMTFFTRSISRRKSYFD